MSGSLYAAISGLNVDQALLANVSNNIANSNTVGYKAGVMTFAQALEQTLSGASAPTATTGGINPIQLAAGSAVTVGGIQVNMSEGNLQTTGINTNLAIEGNGFFIVQLPNGGTGYTRAGAFAFDANGTLVNPQGNPVMGWNAAAIQANNQSATNLTPITIPQNTVMNPAATQGLTASGNLDTSWLGQTVTKSVPLTVYDALGTPINLSLQFENPTSTASGSQSWQVYYTYNGTQTQLGTLTFTNGTVSSYTATANITLTNLPDGVTSFTIPVAQSAFQGMTNYATSTQLEASQLLGNPPGTLQNVSIGAGGVITGTFSNGLMQTLGQVALANFNNPQGLTNVGNTIWQQSVASGGALVGQPNTGSFGSLAAGSVEGSNVNLANEFINMIIAQQGYQANAKVITVDQALRTTLSNMVP